MENQHRPVPGEIVGDSANLKGEQPQDPEFHAELPPVTPLYVPQSALFQTDSEQAVAASWPQPPLVGSPIIADAFTLAHEFSGNNVGAAPPSINQCRHFDIACTISSFSGINMGAAPPSINRCQHFDIACTISSFSGVNMGAAPHFTSHRH